MKVQQKIMGELDKGGRNVRLYRADFIDLRSLSQNTGVIGWKGPLETVQACY